MQNSFELISVENHDGMISTTSLNIAKVFGKEHYHVLRDIQQAMETIGAVGAAEEHPNLDYPLKTTFVFEETTYTTDQGKSMPMFLLNRDATVFLIMGYTGKRATEFKLGYIAAFNNMEKQLNAPIGAVLPDTHISNVNYDACDKLIAEYKKALADPGNINSIAAAKLKGKILKLAVGFDPVAEFDKQIAFETKAYSDKYAAEKKAQKVIDDNDDLYKDLPF